MDSGIGVPIGAEVKLTEKGQLQLIDDEGKVRPEKILEQNLFHIWSSVKNPGEVLRGTSQS